MNKKIHLLLLFLLGLFFSVDLKAQDQRAIDSLLSVLKTSKQDTTKAAILYQLSKAYWSDDPEKLMNYAQQTLQLSEKIGYKRGIANAFNSMGAYNRRRGNYSAALEFYEKSLKLRLAINDKKGIAASYSNIGILNNLQGKYAEAIKLQLMSLKIAEEIQDKGSISRSYSSIGNIYDGLRNYSEALKYFLAALKIDTEIGDKSKIAHDYHNIGNSYVLKGNYQEALKCLFKSLKLVKETGNTEGLAFCYNSIGDIYFKQGNSLEALKNHFAAIEVQKELKNPQGICLSYAYIGDIYTKQKKYNDAEKFLSKSLALSKEIGDMALRSSLYQSLYQLDSARGNYKESLEHLKLYVLTNDSMVNNETSKKIMQAQLQYDFDKKEAISKLEQEKKEALSKKEIEKQKVLRNSFVVSFILVMLIAIGIFRSLQQNKKAKTIITKQKELVENKNKEIIESIEYAKRLQNAILPATKLVKEYLVDSFIFYRPKDIVAGDFYWFYPIPPTSLESNGQTTSENKILFAAADCTGHGVPGAMVSVVCANALNKAVKELHLHEPGKILDAVNDFVTETFTQKDSAKEDVVQDGMDISLCALNLTTLQLQWSGANNPLIIIHSEASTYQELAEAKILELKPDKQPIGLFAERKPFTTQTLQLQKGDMLYLFSDGYADQFGGSEGKKLLKKNMKLELLRIASLPIEVQVTEMASHFESWKGNTPQVDDVCVIGVRV